MKPEETAYRQLNQSENDLQQRMDALRICIVVPTYNNQNTLSDVLNDILQYTSNIIVVNDGSTDDTDDILKSYAGRIEVVSHKPNRGKGYALKTGFNRAEELEYHNVITIDSDGQHFAQDIKRFVEYASEYPGMILLGQRKTEGEMPAKNTFANKFSNFWFTVQTACRLKDTQNGFRLYPLLAMKGKRPLTARYEAELEMLVRLVWCGIKIIPVPTRIYYPPEDVRVTHFRPGKDFFRISLLNTFLTLLSIIYGYPSMIIRRFYGRMASGRNPYNDVVCKALIICLLWIASQARNDDTRSPDVSKAFIVCKTVDTRYDDYGEFYK